MTAIVEVVKGSVEYLYADVRTDRMLTTQVVSFSITSSEDPSAWIEAEWTGNPGKARSARVLLDGTLAQGLYHVFIRITDAPEAPIFGVGRIRVV